jgi:universal stress protein A
MSQYTKILVAVDLSEESAQVAQRGHAIANNNSAELHLIHVIEPLSFAYGGDIPMDFPASRMKSTSRQPNS